MGDWRLRAIHLTSATIRRCRVYTFTSFARTKAGLIISTSISGRKAEGGRPVFFICAMMWHLLPYAESLYYKARRTSARTEVLVVETLKSYTVAVLAVLPRYPRYYRGNWYKSYGITAVLGSKYAGIPWGWGPGLWYYTSVMGLGLHRLWTAEQDKSAPPFWRWTKFIGDGAGKGLIFTNVSLFSWKMVNFPALPPELALGVARPKAVAVCEALSSFPFPPLPSPSFLPRPSISCCPFPFPFY